MKKTYVTFSTIALLIMLSLTLSLSGVAYATSSTEALSRMQRFQEQGKVPAYVLEQGTYKYTEGIRTAHVKGKNVFMRSQPLKNARIIAKLTHVDLEYLGEWKHPKNGERWVCVRRNGEIGWIYGQYIDIVKKDSITNNKSTRTQSDNEHGNENNHSVNWGYVLLGVLILAVAYVITSHLLEWDVNIENFLTFLFYAFLTIIGVVAICTLAYVILKFVWEKIILPILAGIFLLFGLAGGGGTGGGGSSNGTSKSDCCEYPNREYCRTYPLIDFSKESSYFSGYYWCRDHCAYVDPDYDAEYNSENLKHG